jgi:hypothetical protein
MNLPRHNSLLLALALCALSACAPRVSSTRIGTVAPPRPADCELELIDAPLQGGTPDGLELLGYIHASQNDTGGPNDPEMLQALKPEACKLGGEMVSVAVSRNIKRLLVTGSSNTYMVWRHRVAAAAPQKF